MTAMDPVNSPIFFNVMYSLELEEKYVQYLIA